MFSGLDFRGLPVVLAFAGIGLIAVVATCFYFAWVIVSHLQWVP